MMKKTLKTAVPLMLALLFLFTTSVPALAAVQPKTFVTTSAVLTNKGSYLNEFMSVTFSTSQSSIIYVVTLQQSKDGASWSSYSVDTGNTSGAVATYDKNVTLSKGYYYRMSCTVSSTEVQNLSFYSNAVYFG